MKKKFLFYAMTVVLLAGLSSCTDSEVAGGDEPGTKTTEGEAYATISITIPNSNSTATRAEDQEDSEKYEVGTADEYKVSNVFLCFFNKFVLDANGAPTATLADPTVSSAIQTTLITSFPNSAEDGNKNIVYTSIPTKLKVGIYRVYAIVNSDLHSTLSTVLIEETFRRLSVASPQIVYGNTPPANGIMMASRTPSGLTSLPYVEVEIKADNTNSNPAPIVFSVERSVARVDVTECSKDYYTLATTDGSAKDYAHVQVESFTLVNQSRQYYYFRQVGEFAEGSKTLNTNGRTQGHLPASTTGVNALDYYVLDPNTFEKKDITLETEGTNGTLRTMFNNAVNTPHTYTPVPAGGDKNPAKVYTHENCLFKDQQVAGYTTGLIFKAKVTPLNLTYMDGTNAVKTEDAATIALKLGTNYFLSSGRFYTSVEAMIKSGFDIKIGGVTLTDTDLSVAIYQYGHGNTAALEVIKAELDKQNIKFLQGGYCYYWYWIKHFGTGTPEAVNKMQPMEFAVVRNNLYRVTVSDIKGIGEDDDEIDIEIPDKVNEVYLQVTMAVRPWILRDTSIILQ